MTRRGLNADARIKIHAIAAIVKRIEAVHSPAVIQESCLKLSKTVPTAGQNGNPGPRAGSPQGHPRPGRGRAEKRESLKTLPPNCRDHSFRGESLRAGLVSIILFVFSRLNRWAEIARPWRHTGVSSVCHEPRG